MVWAIDVSFGILYPSILFLEEAEAPRPMTRCRFAGKVRGLEVRGMGDSTLKGRDARTGRFNPVKDARRRPNTTVERVPKRGKGGKESLPSRRGYALSIGPPRIAGVEGTSLPDEEDTQPPWA